MTQDHTTTGWQVYDGFVFGLKAAGISYTETKSDLVLVRGSDTAGSPQALRTATFVGIDGTRMIAEEYLARDDNDCDGRSEVKLAVYADGQRPLLYRMILDGGNLPYPDLPGVKQGPSKHHHVIPPYIRLCLNDGTYEVLSEDPEFWPCDVQA